jgi:uncharacterized PurR-regulated membrane protein YhhQ (DUF165 family)
MKWLLGASFLATVPAANWMIGHVGHCVPDGPCLVPVAPELMAPSGVLMVGLALVLRDALQETAGRRAVLACIVAGAAASWLLSPPWLALASAGAFLLAELADFAVYQPLRQRSLAWAVMLSGTVGAVVDSALFLWLAFGSLDFLAGNVVGKLWMSAAAAILLTTWRKRVLA